MLYAITCLVGVLFSQENGFKKENLDQPYDALGEKEDVEENVEKIYFFRQEFNASCIIFALDNSGTMLGEKGDRLKEEVIKTLGQLHPVTEFSIVAFSTKVIAFSETPRLAGFSRISAKIWVEKLIMKGDTYVSEGVIRAITISRKSIREHKRIVLLCDGKPQPEKPQDALKRIIEENKELIPIDTLLIKKKSIGHDTDNDMAVAEAFMREVARLTGGTFHKIDLDQQG